MSHKWGSLPLPVEAPAPGDAVGDHALRVVGDYLAAFLNAYGTTAWQAVQPSRPACGAAYLQDPRDFGFVETYLPALFLFRGGSADDGGAAYSAQDILEAHTTWTAFYVYAPAPQDAQGKRDSFTNAVAKMVALAIEAYRDPAYAAAGDADVTAATTPAAPTAIKLQVASSTLQQVYTAAALDGSVGVGEIQPRRPVLVTLGGDPGSFVHGSAITIEGTDVVGQPLTNVLTVDTGAIPGALSGGNDFAAISKVTVSAQAGTAGTIAIGLGAFAGRGSLYLEQAGLQSLRLAKWKATTVELKMNPNRRYYAVELTLEANEELVLDPEVATYPNTEVGVAFTRSDGSNIESAKY